MYNQFMPQQPMYQPRADFWGMQGMQQPQQPQRSEIIRVNGENGAKAYQMPPSSSVLLLDETAPIVWLAQTDGAGYKTMTPYTITPYQAAPEPDYRSLDDRIKRLEDIINGQKSDSDNAKRSSRTAEPK